MHTHFLSLHVICPHGWLVGTRAGAGLESEASVGTSVEGGLLVDWGGPGSEDRASAHFLSEGGVRGKPNLVICRILDLEGNAELGGGIQTLATYGPPGSCLHISVPYTAPSSSYVSTWVSRDSIFSNQSTYSFISSKELIFKENFASQLEVENPYHV